MGSSEELLNQYLNESAPFFQVVLFSILSKIINFNQKQNYQNALSSHALSRGCGVRLLPWGLPAPGGYGPAVPLCAGLFGVTQTGPSCTGAQELKASGIVVWPPCLRPAAKWGRCRRPCLGVGILRHHAAAAAGWRGQCGLFLLHGPTA